MRLFGGGIRSTADGISAVSIYLSKLGLLAFNALPLGLLNKRTAHRFLHRASTA